MWRFYTLYAQKFSILRPLLSITFPQEFQKSKKFGYWPLGSLGKKTVKRSEKHHYQKILLSKTKFDQKQTFVCAAVLHSFLEKVFESETNKFRYFSPKDSGPLNILDI